MYTYIRNFFWFCAGVNRRLLLECETESSKYFAIGATVFLTACLAALSGGYALYFVFSGTDYALKAAMIFGLLWGITIFNIDRFLVISIKKENRPRKEMLMALPRLALAIVIGIVIARPLELKLFDKEIRDGLKQYYLDEQKQIDDQKHTVFKGKIQDDLNNLDKKKSECANAYDAWEAAKKLQLQEANGEKNKFTSGDKGWGAKTIALQTDVNTKKAIYDKLVAEISAIDQKIKDARSSSRIDEISKMDDVTLDRLVQNAGFHDRNKILGQISSWTPWSKSSKEVENNTAIKNKAHTSTLKNKAAVNVKSDSANVQFPEPKSLTQQRFDGENDKTVFFISMLFIIIECLPIIVKIMVSRGSYDIRLEEEEERIRFLARHETYANKHLIQQLATSQREVLNKAIEQWEENELNSNTLAARYINTDPENNN